MNTEAQYTTPKVTIDIKIDVQTLAVIAGFFFTLWLGLGWL